MQTASQRKRDAARPTTKPRYDVAAAQEPAVSSFADVSGETHGSAGASSDLIARSYSAMICAAAFVDMPTVAAVGGRAGGRAPTVADAADALFPLRRAVHAFLAAARPSVL